MPPYDGFGEGLLCCRALLPAALANRVPGLEAHSQLCRTLFQIPYWSPVTCENRGGPPSFVSAQLLQSTTVEGPRDCRDFCRGGQPHKRQPDDDFGAQARNTALL